MCVQISSNRTFLHTVVHVEAFTSFSFLLALEASAYGASRSRRCYSDVEAPTSVLAMVLTTWPLAAWTRWLGCMHDSELEYLEFTCIEDTLAHPTSRPGFPSNTHSSVCLYNKAAV